MEEEEIRAKYGCCGDYNNCQHSCTSKGKYLEANRQREKRYKHYDNRLAAWEEVDPIIKNDAALCFAAGFDLGVASKTEWVGLSEAERIDIIDEEISEQNTAHFALAQAIEAKLKGKNGVAATLLTPNRPLRFSN